MTKTYRRTFNNKADAHSYYNSLRNRKNLYSRSVCYLVQEHCYEVTHTYTVAEREGK